MNRLKEDFLYYVWRTRQFNHSDLTTTSGEPITIVDYGRRNNASGPDFADARIQIGSTLWAGYVEMHVYASDWTQHKHQLDTAYKNVILHVVFEDDKDITFHQDDEGRKVPTLELKKIIFADTLQRYGRMLASSTWIPCQNLLKDTDTTSFDIWKYPLVVERLWRKTSYVEDLLKRTNNDWDQVAYILVFRYFGGKENADAFEQLSLNMPLSLLLKNINNPLSIAAILYGNAGMLEAAIEDNYHTELRAEYQHQKRKHGLEPMSLANWKFGGMLPPGMPTFRLAQLVALLLERPKLFAFVLQAEKVSDIYKGMQVEAAPYWETHYTFARSSKYHATTLTESFMDRLIINAFLPLMFIYGKHTYNETLCDKAITMLEDVKAEQNQITKKWSQLGLKGNSACDTQALIQLRNEYCQNLRCTECQIGHKILSNHQ